MAAKHKKEGEQLRRAAANMTIDKQILAEAEKMKSGSWLI